MPADTTTAEEFEDAALPDWRFISGAIHTRLATGNFQAGLDLLNQIGAAAEDMNHHPDLDLRYTHLEIRLLSHDANGVTDRDLTLARQISTLASEAGIKAEPRAIAVLEIGLDTADYERIKPFWRAVLGLRGSDTPHDLVDPDGHLTGIWFQQTEPHEEPRQRFHLDISVAPDEAETRIQAALDAGGTLVTDAYAPAFWVLADADGNKACVCTALGRN